MHIFFEYLSNIKPEFENILTCSSVTQAALIDENKGQKSYDNI